MPFQLSPGVNITEIDLTTVVPAVSTTDSAIGGVFRWGPVGKTQLVVSQDELVAKYGKPTNLNAETFFTASNFLAYGNKLNVSRASHVTGNNSIWTTVLTEGSNTVLIVNEDETGISEGDAIVAPGYLSEGTTVTTVTVNGANTELVLSTQPLDTANVDVQYFDDEYCFNAIANTNACLLSGQIVKNEDEYENVDFDTDVQWVAKYPGEIGNSLKISVCDSANSFTSTANVSGANVSFTVGSNTATTATDISNEFSIGDVLKVGSSTIGYAYLTVSGANTTAIQFTDRYTLAENISMDASIERRWQYWEAVDGAPGQSNYQMNYGNTSAQDELHVVVVDEDGKFTGVPGTILEVFQGVSRATDGKTDDGSNNYYKDVINSGSQYVWWAGDRSGAVSATASELVSSTNVVPSTQSFAYGRDTKGEDTIGMVDLINAYDAFKSAEDIDISLILAGKARGAQNGAQLANYIIDNIVEERKDCVLFVSPEKADVVGNSAGDEEADVVEFRNSITSTSYAVLDSGYKYQYDKFNDTYRWIPLNGDIAGVCAATDAERDAWWSPAGFNRGQIKNAVKLAWNPKKAERDLLYKNGINPVVNFPGEGIVLYGDKTLLSKPSAFDRINVRRLFIVLEKAIAVASKYTLFEFNDDFTRTSFVNLVTPFLRDIQGRRGIYDFKVVCDATNNTGEVIDRNEFVGDIYIKPSRSINFIQLNFVAVRSGVEFSEITGQ